MSTQDNARFATDRIELGNYGLDILFNNVDELAHHTTQNRVEGRLGVIWSIEFMFPSVLEM